MGGLSVNRHHFVVITWFLAVSVGQAVTATQEPSVVSVRIGSHGSEMRGKVFLSGQKAVAPTVLLLHGWPGSPDDVLGLGALLSRQGITVVMFNPRGMHASDGTASFAHALEDIGAALEWLRLPEMSQKFGVDHSPLLLP